jgi:hypothetical protein
VSILENGEVKKEKVTMNQQPIQANRFVLKGEGLEITYDETTIAGPPQLTYQVVQGVHSRTFSGNELSSKGSDIGIGTLVTVTLEVIPDDKSTLFTLLIPTINLTGTNEVHFETLAIYTTVRDSFIGPNGVSGALQSYQCVQLEGTAQFVTP